MTKVSAIVSAYFAKDYIEGRLKNLIDQRPKPEIVVVCQAGSIENGIADSFYLRYPKVEIKIVLTEEIPTVYRAWNLGIAAATGDYITNANSDDRLIKRNALKIMADTLDKNPDYALVYSNCEIVDKIGGAPVGFFDWAKGGFRELLDGCFVGPMPMWRKSLHVKHGNFDESMASAGDYEFWLRIASRDEKLLKIEKTLGAYLRSENSVEHRNSVQADHEALVAKMRYRGERIGKNAHILIGTPKVKPWETQYIASLITTRLFSWLPVPNKVVDVARNIISVAFKENKKYDFLLMTDCDAAWTPQAVDRLVSRNLPVVCGVFFKRDLPPVPTMGPVGGVDVDGATLYSFGETIKKIVARINKSGLEPDQVKDEMVLEETEDDLFEIDGCGMHFVLIRRDVIEALKEPYFQLTSPNAGEDFYFCRKVRAAGFKIYVDLSVYVGHMHDDQDFGIKEFLMFVDEKEKGKKE